MTTGNPSVRVEVAQLALGPDLVPHIGQEDGGAARPLLGDVPPPEPQGQRRGDVDEAPQGSARLPEPPDEAAGRIEDVPGAVLVAGRVGDERGGVDDVRRPGRKVDPVGEAEVALDQPDVEAVQEAEIGGFPDEGVHLPAALPEPAAEIGADETVGARDQHAAHGVSPGRRAVFRFQALAMAGAAKMMSTAAAIPRTMSDR